MSSRVTGGEIVARTLRDLGATTVFAVSGNQILPIFDAAPDAGLRIIHMRHESAAAYAALAFAESAGQPGVLLVSAGPGFLAAATGVASAMSAELPLLFLSGACATGEAGNGGFQDVDQRTIAGVIGKASFEPVEGAALPSVLSRAWSLAGTDVPGVVHVSLPSDMLVAMHDIEDQVGRADPAVDGVAPTPDGEAVLHAMAECLMSAERPLIIARPSANRGNAAASLWRLSRHLGIEPVVTESPRGTHDLKYRQVTGCYPESDCALVIAPGDFAVGFFRRSAIATTGSLLHIDTPGDPRPERRPDLHLRIGATSALAFLADATARHRPRLSRWTDLWLRRPPDELRERSDTALHPLEVAQAARGLLRPDDCLVLDGGEYCQWIRAGLSDLPNRMFWNSKLGAIGGGIPMGLGFAAAGSHGHTIVFVGDGAFGYHAAELETAVRCGLPLVVVVGHDARWGAEWHLQAARYGAERIYATELLAASYHDVARGLGAQAFAASDASSLGDALAVALACGQPACVNVRIASVRSPAVMH
jgi:acetolactate synthase I/II/III large subunit